MVGNGLLLLAATAATAAPADEESLRSLAAMRELDGRLATAGHRLATAAVDLCAERTWRYGFFLHDLSQYGRRERAAAVRAFGLDRGPAILAVAEDGPAERAGLRRDDIVLQVDGAALPAAVVSGKAEFGGVERMLDALDAAFADGRAEIELLRGSGRRTVTVEAVPGCPTRFQLMPSRELNARADGRYVQLSTAIADYAVDDAEFAAVIAHEFAHNLLQHRRRLDAAGVDRGFFGHFGGSARLFRHTEDEADRLSIHLLARAGYDPGAAVRFWNRFGPRGLAIFGSPKHHKWRARVRAMHEEIAAVAAAKEKGAPSLPEFLRRAWHERDEGG